MELTERIMRGDYADDEEAYALLDTLKRETGHPRVSDLIFWPHHEVPGRSDLSAEEVVERALSHRPFAL